MKLIRILALAQILNKKSTFNNLESPLEASKKYKNKQRVRKTKSILCGLTIIKVTVAENHEMTLWTSIQSSSQPSIQAFRVTAF